MFSGLVYLALALAAVVLIDILAEGPFYKWIHDLLDKKKYHDVEKAAVVDTNMFFDEEKIDELKRQKTHSKEELRNLEKEIKDLCEEKPFIIFNVDSKGNVIENKAFKPKTKNAIFDELRTALDEEDGLLVME